MIVCKWEEWGKKRTKKSTVVATCPQDAHVLILQFKTMSYGTADSADVSKLGKALIHAKPMRP